MQVDNDLSWKGHIKGLSTKISRALGFLNHARNLFTQDTPKTLYTSIVEPDFRYCCSVWGNCGANEKNHLQTLQTRAARILTNCHFDGDGRPPLSALGVKTIQELIDTEINTMFLRPLMV